MQVGCGLTIWISFLVIVFVIARWLIKYRSDGRPQKVYTPEEIKLGNDSQILAIIFNIGSWIIFGVFFYLATIDYYTSPSPGLPLLLLFSPLGLAIFAILIAYAGKPANPKLRKITIGLGIAFLLVWLTHLLLLSIW